MSMIIIYIHILFLIARVDIRVTLNMTDIQDQNKFSVTKNDSWHHALNNHPLFA